MLLVLGVKQWRTAWKDLGIFQAAGVWPVLVACRELCCSQGCALAGNLVSARFPKEVGVGKRLGSPELICGAGGTESLAAQPCLHSSHP